MTQLITIRMKDQYANFDLPENKITKASVRTAMFLGDDALLALSYSVDGAKRYCRVSEDGLEFLLPNEFSRVKFVAESNKTPSRATSSQNEKESPEKKRRRIDPSLTPMPVSGDLVAQIRQRAWYFTRNDGIKRAVTPVGPNHAITYSHGKNQQLSEGDVLELFQYQNPQNVVNAVVVKIDNYLDLIVLKSTSAELSDKDLLMEAVEPKKGMKYTVMGFSVCHSGTNRLSFSAGIIGSDLTSRLRYLGSSGAYGGDSGGSCWTDDGKLIGMVVETENALTSEKRPSSPVPGGECGIISIARLHATIVDSIPAEDHCYIVE